MMNVHQRRIVGTAVLLCTLVFGAGSPGAALARSLDDVGMVPNDLPVALADACPTPVTSKIGSVQGTVDASPSLNQTVVLSGTVVGDFQGSSGLNGFYIQDDGDSNAATSDGIFVFVPAANALSSIDVVAGESIQVAGTVREFLGQTELDTVTAITKCGTGVATLPAVVNLPETTNGELERYEGMLVNMPQTLTVEQNFFQGRYGQVTLGLGRLFQPTNLYRPGTPEAQALVNSNARSLFVLDDAKSAQNPNPIPYIGIDTTLRAGDTTSNLTGVLDFGPINSNSAIRDYRLQPTAPVSFTRVNARAAPEDVGGNIKVASFNVLNYFNTFAAAGSQCYPGNTQTDCRGANSAAEFQRQRDKIIAAIKALNADVVGLIEIENDGSGPDSAIQDLVNGLNAATAPNTYAVIADPAGIGAAAGSGVYPGGDDAIKTALVYKPASVAPIGAAVASPDEAFSNARAPIAQTFEVASNGEKFSVIVNHFKSKSGAGTGADADQNDGQGSFNASRVAQANALLGFINTTVISDSGDQDVLVIGDLNAYGKEDPVVALTSGGLIDQLAKRITNPYSYVFDGLAGYLDHALTTASLDAQVSGVTEWHINADEPSVIDYNTEFKPQDLYAPTPYKASDHDPVLIGLDLQSGPVTFKYFVPLVLTETPPITPAPTPVGGVPTPSGACATNAPAPAEGAQAWMTEPQPSQNANTTLCVRLVAGGQPGSGATASAKARYKTTVTDLGPATTGSDGVATITFRIGNATIGYQVNVEATVGGASATTSFTPR